MRHSSPGTSGQPPGPPCSCQGGALSPDDGTPS
jgi:hypothetical protein